MWEEGAVDRGEGLGRMELVWVEPGMSWMIKAAGVCGAGRTQRGKVRERKRVPPS